ncbi:filamentous hemagglutinin family outer membrane protein [Klebsiella aerogenes]|nr:filamentous hemagglutinin family outer membrane protein [Klebsiella aerogenes]
MRKPESMAQMFSHAQITRLVKPASEELLKIKAYAGALASAGLIYLPGGMQITGAIGGTANAGIQYLMNGEVNPTDVLIATYVGAFTANTGAWGTVGWNAAGGATSSYLKGDNPFTGGLINGLASGWVMVQENSLSCLWIKFTTR